MSELEQKVDQVMIIPIVKSKHNKVVDNEIFQPGKCIISELESIELVFDKNKRIKDVNKKKSVIRLDENYSKVDYVPGLKTTLYDHQRVTIKAMLDFEYFQCIKFNKNNVKAQFSNAVLSNPVGSGKTLMILSLIILQKVPKAYVNCMNNPFQYSNTSYSYIKRKFKKFVTPTLILVGISVMKQWEQAIKQYTNLKVLIVNNIYHLNDLISEIENDTISQYDIILVKNGKVTVTPKFTKFELNEKNKGTECKIYNVISNLYNVYWSRIIIDDFDTIKLPVNASVIPAIFTWYVSATVPNIKYSGDSLKSNIDYYKKYPANSVLKCLENINYDCNKIFQNNFIFNYLNVCCDLDFIKNTIQMPKIKYHVSVFKNPNNTYISLLSAMGDENINKITEMLNADAIGDAAQAAGIETSSVSNIFESILGDKFNKYKFANALLEFIEYLISNESDRKPMSENPDEEDTYTKSDLLKFRDVEYKYPGINQIIKNTKEEYTEIFQTNGIAIQRVKDNISNNACPVCQIELTESKDIVISKCCGTVFCGNCGIECQNLKDRVNKLKGRCANCRTSISIKDLIYMRNFDLTKINEDKYDSESDSDVNSEEDITEHKIDVVDKYKAIIEIIKGNKIVQDKRVDLHLSNMMKGNILLEDPTYHKVLVFANYEETLNKVIAELKTAEINYLHLKGNSTEINNIANTFNSSKETTVLLINSTKQCSGLNLQTATDLIFSHSILDKSIETQVAGRGHRLGRTSNLNIWFMQYDNEYETLKSTHDIRELSPKEID
jgi:superfamily II DNA or RNA helicase